MNFDRTDDQQLLVNAVSDFLKRESPITRARRLRDDSQGFSKELWKEIGALGWMALPFPEEMGGFGCGFVDACLILEQMGTTLFPEPYLSSVVLAGRVLERAASDEQRENFLAPMMSGDATLALAVAERSTRYGVRANQTKVTRKGSQYVLDGEKLFVLDGHQCDQVIVSACLREDDGSETQTLWVIDPSSMGVSWTAFATLDGRRAAHYRFKEVNVSEARRLTGVASTEELLEEVMDRAAIAACAEGVGIADSVLAMTLDYLRTREQFGVAIGTFQALQHRAADMFVEVELLRSSTLVAMVRATQSDKVARASDASAAKAQLGVGGKLVVQQAVQLHGGIGITDEHDLGLYFKRMQTLLALFGDEHYHSNRFAQLRTFTQGLDLNEALQPTRDVMV